MTDHAELRIRDYLKYWDTFAAQVHAEGAEADVCEPPCEPETDPDIICGEYKYGYHILRASDIKHILQELAHLRELHRAADIRKG